MADIKNPRILWLKFMLFLLVGMLAIVASLVLFPDLRLAFLIAVAIWAFCRAYYFAFYVIERYSDPTYRFSGLGSFVRYALRDKTPSRKDDRTDDSGN